MSAGVFEPTGRQRYRIERLGWRGRNYVVVLQIEVTGYDIEWPGVMTDRTFWRDATVGDVTLLNGANYGDSRLCEGRV